LGPLETTGVVASRLSRHPSEGITNLPLNLDCIQAANNQQKPAAKIPENALTTYGYHPFLSSAVSTDEPALQS
jgi:hypothetical protein